MARDPDIDAAVVATPNALHAPQSIALLESGTHVLVEKPMATSVAECDAMIEASAAGAASLMVAHCWRFHPDVQAMRARIQTGELGEIVKTRGYGVHAGWGPSGWFTERALAGGGALPDMGVHAIDTVRYLLGDPDAGRVCAVIGTRYGTYDVDDDGILLISWSQGTNSIVESGWWQPHKEGLEAETEVYGTKGYGRIFPREEPSEDYEHCTQPMYTAQMRRSSTRSMPGASRSRAASTAGSCWTSWSERTRPRRVRRELSSWASTAAGARPMRSSPMRREACGARAMPAHRTGRSPVRTGQRWRSPRPWARRSTRRT